MFQTNSSIIGLRCWEHAKQSKCGDTRESEKTPHTKKIDKTTALSLKEQDMIAVVSLSTLKDLQGSALIYDSLSSSSFWMVVHFFLFLFFFLVNFNTHHACLFYFQLDVRMAVRCNFYFLKF
jgi:hypothetical protein